MPYEKSSPASPEAQSGSPVQENLQALAALFPSVVRDGQVDIDALRQLCGEAVVKENELFGLNWRGKTEARRAALSPSLGTLRPCKEESKYWDTTQNLYIEGDNLEVLKLLRKSYGGKVKMIYIDPPYNTGKEFVYPDDYQNSIENYKKLTGQKSKYAANVETSGRYHTDWLNMMYPRLILARDLLSADGVIFISIDDNEVDNLRKICDEIFGESNFIVSFIWKRRQNVDSRSKNGASTDHEYCLAYSASSFGQVRGADKDMGKYSNPDNDPRGNWMSADMTGLATKEQRPNLHYDLIHPETGVNYGCPVTGWRYEPKRMAELMKNGEVLFPRDSSGRPRRKKFQADLASEFTGKSSLLNTVYNTQATRELRELFKGKDYFDFPKPVDYIKEIIQQGSGEGAIILDFFSGSATTAHAVMKLNAEDGGKRRFIMVQLPEPCEQNSEAYKDGHKTICEIGKERIRSAGVKEKDETGLVGLDLDIGFRVYKLDSSNVKAWNPQADDLATAVNNFAEHLVGGRTEDDFLTEIMLKSGIDLVEEVQEREIAGHRVQSLGYGQYYACMAADLADDAEDVALGIAAWHEEDCAFAGGEQQDTCTVFVSDRAFASNDAAKMNFVAILEQHGICNIKAL